MVKRLSGRCYCGVAIEIAQRDPIDHRLCARGDAPPDPFCPGEVCDTRLTWVAMNPDAHLRCFGLRWCGVCGDAARYGGNCPSCHRARSRKAEAAARAAKAERYEKQKARKRERYVLDPIHAEEKRIAAGDYWFKLHPVPAANGKASAVKAARGTLRGKPRGAAIAA